MTTLYDKSYTRDLVTGTRTWTGQQHVVLSDYISRPATTKRIKPVDLFRYGTSRRVASAATSYTFGSLVTVSRKQAVDAPFSYWTQLSPAKAFREPITPADFADLDQRIRLKIKDQNINLAQTVAEYRQVGNLLFDVARDVVSTFHKLRSGRKMHEFLRVLKHPETRNGRRTARRWLEYQYGWLPLLSDIHGGCEALAKEIQGGKMIMLSLSDRQKATLPITYVLGGGSTKSTIKRRVTCRYVIRDKSLKTLSEIGITNPLLLGWELMPWSFVIDWLLPVGDYLSALDALAGVEDLVVQRNYRLTFHSSQTLTYSGGGQYFLPYPEAKGSEIISGRLGVQTGLSFGRLGYEPSLTATKMANAAALLRQLKR